MLNVLCMCEICIKIEKNHVLKFVTEKNEEKLGLS